MTPATEAVAKEHGCDISSGICPAGDMGEPCLCERFARVAIQADFLGMGLIIKEQREKIARLELENKLLFDHIKGDDVDLSRFNAALEKALSATPGEDRRFPFFPRLS